jgi:hypothetical protein
VHHIRHQADGGETSVANCVLLCQFHHDVAIHRLGWQIVLHPDGITTVFRQRPREPRVAHSHPPPVPHAPPVPHTPPVPHAPPVPRTERP